jgi:hypothetical protein
VALIWSIIDANVDVFPDPVGPVTNTNPRCSPANRATTGGNPKSAIDGIDVATRRNTIPTEPRCRNTLQRNRPIPFTLNAKSHSFDSANSTARAAGTTTTANASKLSGVNRSNGASTNDPSTRTLGGNPTFKCKSEALASTTKRKTAAKSNTPCYRPPTPPGLSPAGVVSCWHSPVHRPDRR